MKKFVGAAVVAAAVSFTGWVSLAPASAAPPATKSAPDHGAKPAESGPTDVSARRRYYRRYGYAPRYYRPYRPYYRPYGYAAPYYGYSRPRYYRPYGYGGYGPYGYGPGYGYGYGRGFGPGLGFGFRF